MHPFCNLQSRARTHAVLVIGLYELLGNPTTQLIEPPLRVDYIGHLLMLMYAQRIYRLLFADVVNRNEYYFTIHVYYRCLCTVAEWSVG